MSFEDLTGRNCILTHAIYIESMDLLRKAIAIIVTCLLFTALAVASIVASALVLLFGIIMLVWVKYKAPAYTTTSRTTHSNIIDGEYRVIETTQIIESSDKQS